MATKRELTKAVNELELKVAALEEPSNIANLKVAKALQEWHTGKMDQSSLSVIQDKAMVHAKRLGDMKTRLKSAKWKLEDASKKDKEK
jgi:hypothetical protein